MRILCERLGESRAPNSFDHGADLLRTAFLKRTKNTLLVLNKIQLALYNYTMQDGDLY